MQLSNHFLSLQNPPVLSHHHRRDLICKFTALSLANSSKPGASESLQLETLTSLEWPALCHQFSSFTQTSMGLSFAREARIPFGKSRDQSQKLLDQTSAALAVMQSQQLDLSKIEDISGIINSAVSGQLLSLSEICAVGRTLREVSAVWEKLKKVTALEEDSLERYSPLLDILKDCNFQTGLEQKIGYCIDCNLSIILDRASEELEIIREERKRNMENLDALLKDVSTRIYQAGGIDKPLITKRRSRMCVGIKASHKYLLPDGVVLNVSSSGATYFMEPKDAVELNNMEVKLSISEKAEEMAILSLLTVEIVKSEIEIKYFLDKVLEVDLAFARAGYAQWMNGVCPILSSENCEGFNYSENNCSLSVNIEAIRHPLLLGSSSTLVSSNSRNSASLEVINGVMNIGSLSKGVSDFPTPIDIKVEHETRVVVISGPNTGGKTASMKTLGLASLMSKAGMFLPSKNNPRLPWFDLVLADIGDHQSLEQNLSTFSGHISRIIEIMEVVSRESLVLIDEIGSGTDPSEGVALATGILQYLKDCVGLAIVTTHYADLSCLKDKDSQFENAAMEFSMETLRPTYKILWGSTGDSNALNIAKTIGCDRNIIERAKQWVERLRPEQQQQWKGELYQSLTEERSKLEGQVRRAASLNAEIMDLYHEIQEEAKDIDRREAVLREKEAKQVQKELHAAKSKIETVVQEFENQLKTASVDQFNSLVKKSESGIASIVEAHLPADDDFVNETTTTLFTPKFGEQVHVKGLGDKLAIVVEAPGDDETVLVQYGKIRVRVKKNNIKAVPSNRRNVATSSIPPLKKQGYRSDEFKNNLVGSNEEAPYSPRVQTSKNTVDLRGMRAEEAAHHLDMAISATGSRSILFIVHGMGTGVVKERALDMLRSHQRVAKKMLAVFEKAIGNPPEELSLPSAGLKNSKSWQEIAENFQSRWLESTFCNLSNGNFMAVSHEDESPLLPRSLVVIDDIFCIFIGTLENMCELNRHYGLSRLATEAMVLIEAYKVLRDRAPYPPDQVIKELEGKFAFVLFDAKSHTLFAGRDRDGSINFKWGMAGNGSLIFSDDPNFIGEACGKSCSAFPPGCIFMNGSGLISFVHPLRKVRAIMREDDDGNICGVTFQVDLLTRLHSIPRTGSAANWADVAVVEAE